MAHLVGSLLGMDSIETCLPNVSLLNLHAWLCSVVRVSCTAWRRLIADICKQHDNSYLLGYMMNKYARKSC